MQESEQLFQDIKKFFGCRVCDQVIEISDKPMSEWVVHYTSCDDEIYNIRNQLGQTGLPFAAFDISEDNLKYKYHYNDHNMAKSIEVFSDEVTYFHDKNFCEYDLKKIRNELKQLMKIAD